MQHSSPEQWCLTTAAPYGPHTALEPLPGSVTSDSVPPRERRTCHAAGFLVELGLRNTLPWGKINQGWAFLSP